VTLFVCTCGERGLAPTDHRCRAPELMLAVEATREALTEEADMLRQIIREALPWVDGEKPTFPLVFHEIDECESLLVRMRTAVVEKA
jgi:hypothetical protein